MAAGKETPRMEIRIPLIVWIGLALVVLLVVGVLCKDQLFPAEVSFHTRLQALADKVNMACPLPMDESTRLERVRVLPNLELELMHTLVDKKKDEIDLKTFLEGMGNRVKVPCMTPTDMEDMRRNNVTLIYSFFDREGRMVVRVPGRMGR